MKKEKWLLKEIDKWGEESLISADTVRILKERYSSGKSANTLIVLFSIIGSILIGAGIILLAAKNWYYFPKSLKVIIAYLPLLVSQALSVYVVKVKYSSLAWRESVSILLSASVFTVVALVGQIFHFYGDFGAYVLACGLLVLPAIYILNAAAPLVVYYWTIINWAALDHSVQNAPILLGLFAAGALFVFLNRNSDSARLLYMTWITVIEGFAVSLLMGIILNSSLLLIALCYFTLLLSVEKLPESLLVPFKIAGTSGALITLAILTYESMWNYFSDAVRAGGMLLAGIMLIAALYFSIMTFRADRLKTLFAIALIFMCLARLSWSIFGLDTGPYDIILTFISNIVLFSIGVGFILHGVKNISLLTTNIGMTAICALIIMRFLDSGMDFLWRGIIFVVLGLAFLMANLKILNKKKTRSEGIL